MSLHPMVTTRRFTLLVTATHAYTNARANGDVTTYRQQRRVARKIEGWLMSDFDCARSSITQTLRDTKALHERIMKASNRFEAAYIKLVHEAGLDRAKFALKPNTRSALIEYRELLYTNLRDLYFPKLYDWAFATVERHAATTTYDILQHVDIDDLVESFMNDATARAEAALAKQFTMFMANAADAWEPTIRKLQHAIRDNTDLLLHAELNAIMTTGLALVNDAQNAGMPAQHACALGWTYVNSVVKDRIAEIGYEVWGSTLSVQVPTFDDPTAWTPEEIAASAVHSDGSKEQLFREFADLDDIEVLQELYDGIYSNGGGIDDDDRAQIEGFALDRLPHLAGLR